MLSEPALVCRDCGLSHTLAQGAGRGMRCGRCGGELVAVDVSWISAEADTDQIPIPSDFSSNPPCAAELLLPAHNEVDEEAVGQFLSSLPLPLALEMYAAGDRRVMLVRGRRRDLRYLAGKIQTLWPSAVLRPLESDPVEERSETLASAVRCDFAFQLKEACYLPIRTWKTFLQGDPVHSLLAAMLGLEPHERIWLQVFLARKGEPAWLPTIQRRLKLEFQRGYGVDEGGTLASRTPAFGQSPLPQNVAWANGTAHLLVILFAFVMALLAVQGKWFSFSLFSISGISLGGLLWRFLGRPDDPWHGADLSLVRQKVVYQDTFYQAVVRASVWAKSPGEARLLAGRLGDAVAQYAVAGGNRFAIAPDPFAGQGAWPEASGVPDGVWTWLGPDEIAGLWHPPIVNERLSPGLVPVRGVEMRSPDPEDVRGFYKIGSYFTADGAKKAVHISATALKHNIFCIGKPDAGKSTLMLHLSRAAMADRDRPALILIDPHGDLVDEFLGTLDPADADRIRIFDITDKDYAYTLNPLDVHRAGWGVIEVTNSIVDIGQALWTRYWGPRMQIPLKRGVQLLTAANELRPKDACLGLSQLAAVLNADAGVRRRFIARDLDGSPHRQTLAKYFLHDYEELTRNFREQVIQPVLSKAHRFEEEPMLPIFSCPESKLNVGEIVRDRNVLVINTGKNKYGSEVSDFVGSLMINIVLMELIRQGEKNFRSRVPVLIVIDEFQTFTGVSWEDLIQQMRKYGGRMILGTQSMASLRKQDPEIPEIILSGVYSLFAFTMNGDDAAYISKNELSGEKGGPSADTLISLEPHKAYVRLERLAGGLGRPFYFESEPPPEFDRHLADRIYKLRANYSLLYEAALRNSLDMHSIFSGDGRTISRIGTHTPRSHRLLHPARSRVSSTMSPEKESCVIRDGLRDVELPRHFCADREEIPRKSGLLCVSGEIAAEEWRDFLSGFEESLKDAGEEGEEANFRR
ncbi:MAG: type IV secretion system DNA-binding domain-containing protein [Anaerolineales bacterium]